MVQPKPLPPLAPPYPLGFNENARCNYHAGSPGHNIENCRGFKHKVQELVDRKLILFKKESHSGVFTPLP
ncbi:gag-protease polyprotein [Trifolium medium]|uniref:Gag-protease polyprotein n=1 Tax=Trifolium medium TaxID=97028 RepID=A0A392SW05_9FABA|nr:gag-protease polyprotein [Trifolium medium]